MKMNKTQVVAAFAEKYNYTKESANEIYNDIVDFMLDSLEAGNEICLKNVFVIGTRERKEWRGLNFQTGAVESRPATRIPYCEFRDEARERARKSMK